MGYGTDVPGVDDALAMDINPVMITCDVTNIGSRKIMILAAYCRTSLNSIIALWRPCAGGSR
jgi:predicted acetyltransferase